MIHNNDRPTTLVVIDKETKKETIFASFTPESIKFAREQFQKNMETIGVQIPPQQRKDFQSRSVVYLNNKDPEKRKLFERAFREIYYPLHLPKDEYQWRSNL